MLAWVFFMVSYIVRRDQDCSGESCYFFSVVKDYGLQPYSQVVEWSREPGTVLFL